MKDASLDEFLDASEDDSEESQPAEHRPDGDGRSPPEDPEVEAPPAETAEGVEAESTAAAEGDASAPGLAVDGVEPAVSTSRWVPGGTECDRCAGESRRVWIDDEEQVCRSCKEW